MRKLSVISAFLTLFLVLLALPSIAWATIYDWSVGVEIDPADAFDKSKMVRTFTYDGIEYDDLSVVYATDNEFRLCWFKDYFIPKMDGRAKLYLQEGTIPPPIDNESANMDRERFLELLCVSAWRYPSWDIVSINGEPWQNTVYADVIVQAVSETVKPGELLADKNSDAWAMFMDPRTNGASHVWFGDPYDHSYPGSIWTAVLDYSVDKISKYNPLNNGKPFDFANWRNPRHNDSQDDKTDNEQGFPKEHIEVELFPNPEWQQAAVLLVGNPHVTIVNGGVTKTNLLNVAPEVVSGRTMIPLRGVLDELGYELNYEGERQFILLSGQGQSITLTIGESIAVVNSKDVRMDQPAIIKDGRALVPLRFMSENLGFRVDYDNGKITISK